MVLFHYIYDLFVVRNVWFCALQKVHFWNFHYWSTHWPAEQIELLWSFWIWYFLFLLLVGAIAFMFQDSNNTQLIYEDRTSRFFPSAPRVPRMPGVASGDTGFMDESEDSFRELSNTSHQRFNILCSGDKEGSICFSIFGIFPIGKIVSH